MTARWLTDDHDLFYDSSDIFSYAVEGGAWTDRWCVAGHRSVQVGDDVFIVGEPGGSNPAVRARGRVVAAEPDDQIRSAEPDFSAAYCSDLYGTDGLDVLWIRIDLDSAVDPDQLLSLEGLAAQPGCTGLSMTGVRSGDGVPDTLVPALMRHWDEHVDRLAADSLSVRLVLP